MIQFTMEDVVNVVTSIKGYLIAIAVALVLCIALDKKFEEVFYF